MCSDAVCERERLNVMVLSFICCVDLHGYMCVHACQYVYIYVLSYEHMTVFFPFIVRIHYISLVHPLACIRSS